MKRFYILLLLILTCACSKQTNQPIEEVEFYEDISPVLVLVQGSPITQKDFDLAFSKLDDSFKPFVQTKTGRDNFLAFLISEKMLQLDAQARGLDKTQDFIDKINAFEESQKIALQEAKTFALRQALFENLENEGVLGVSEQEIKDYYDKYSYEISLLQFIVDDAQKAADIMKQMKNVRSAQRFGDFARQYSIDPLTKSNGGKMLPFIPGEYLPQIEVAAANSKLMELQGFIKTAQGFHIIMKVGENKLSFNEAKDRIKKILENQKLDVYLNSLKQKYEVEVNNNENK